jgi:hypothetical protein
MFGQTNTLSHPLAAAFLVALTPAQAAPDACGFVRAFDQPDKTGHRIVHVYRGASSGEIGGVRPFAFVVPVVKVNTDGTRISYNADDPRAQAKAINDIRNAFHNPGRPISDFEKIRDAGWQPTSAVWNLLDQQIIEKDKRPGKQGLPVSTRKTTWFP